MVFIGAYYRCKSVNYTLIVHNEGAAAELNHNGIANLQSVGARHQELVIPLSTSQVGFGALDIQEDQKLFVAMVLPVPIPLELCPNHSRALVLPYTHTSAEGKKRKEVPCRHANLHVIVSTKDQRPSWFVPHIKDPTRIPTASKS